MQKSKSTHRLRAVVAGFLWREALGHVWGRAAKHTRQEVLDGDELRWLVVDDHALVMRRTRSTYLLLVDSIFDGRWPSNGTVNGGVVGSEEEIPAIRS